jgi:membrane protease YdiL (CAAX protease family)
MIMQYGKPLLETMGAILAGLILGTLALRTGSIWCGALIHISVAITMDVLALVHTGWRVWNRCGM